MTSTLTRMKEVLCQLKETIIEEEERDEPFEEEEQVKEYESIISEKLDSYVSLLEDEFFSLPMDTILNILKQRNSKKPMSIETCKLIIQHAKTADLTKTLGASELLVLPYLNIDEKSVSLDDCISLVGMCDSIPILKAFKHLTIETSSVDFDWEYEYLTLEKKYKNLKVAFDQLQEQALQMQITQQANPLTDVPQKPADFESDIHQACYDGNLDSVKYLIYNNKSLLEKRDLSGCTPLLCASIVSKQDIILYLVEQGANVNAQCRGFSYKGYTPLHFAYKSGKDQIVKILLDNGADTEICDMYGVKPIQLQTTTHSGN